MTRSAVRVRAASVGAVLGAAAVIGLGACSSGSGTTDVAVTAATSSTPTSTSSSPTTEATPTVSQLVASTKAKLAAAKSGRVKGGGDDDGTRVEIESAGTLDGSTETGTISRGDAKAEYIAVDGKAFVRGNEAYWVVAGAPAATARTLGANQKYVQVPAEKAKSLIESATIVGVVNELVTGSADVTDANTKLTSKEVGGRPAWVLADAAKSGTSVTIDKGTMLPIRMDGGTEGSFEFDQWDAVPTPTAPPASQIYTP